MALQENGIEEGSREQMEVTMHKSIVAIVLLGAGVLLGTSDLPTLAAGPGRLPATVVAPSLQLIGGYKYCHDNGCYYCQRRECDDYDYSYGHKYCKHYAYYDCSPYRGGGGGGGGGY
ncbi:MAG: hypothetical protein JJE37_02285 [Methyloceanibacter sp.]|jgi:hypothetical protein|nr:hypothetical protein [Methyloceanibacter sp.]